MYSVIKLKEMIYLDLGMTKEESSLCFSFCVIIFSAMSLLLTFGRLKTLLNEIITKVILMTTNSGVNEGIFSLYLLING